MTEARDTLEELTERLARAAEQLRSGGLDPDAAAALIEECSRTAGDAAAELERRIRGTGALDVPPGQEQLI